MLLVAVGLFIWFVKSIVWFVRFFFNVDPGLLDVARRKKARQQSLLDDFITLHPLSAELAAKNILRADVAAIVEAITVSRIWTAEEVMLAYCHEAARVHSQLNCLTEIMFEDGLKMARELDKRFKEDGEAVGCLHGVPVSLKDHVAVKGYDSTVGTIKWAFKPKVGDAPIVTILKRAGAIPFVKTNVPQTMMTFECANPLWGLTQNPIVKNYSPGGSSGGEAALIKAGGSVLGIGSDIAGSLRIPAHFSGICVLKPSTTRIPFSGSQGFLPAPLLIHPVNGPMARTVKDLALASQVVFGQRDVNVSPRPFDHSIYPFLKSPTQQPRKLRVGVMKDDGFVTPTPACARAVQEAADALRRAGHDVVPFSFPFDIVEMVATFYGIISSDGGHYYLSATFREPIDRSVVPFFLGIHLNPTVHRLLAWMLGFIISDRRLLALINQLGIKDVKDLAALQGRRVGFQRALAERWSELGLDVVLCPVNALPASPYGSFAELNFAASYTLTWNMLDCAAGVIPVTTVDPVRDACRQPKDFLFPSIISADYLDQNVRKYYNPALMAGLPVGVQVVAPQFCEEQALYAMHALELAIKSGNNES